QFAKLVDREARRHPVDALFQHFHFGCRMVVLVNHFTDELLEEVFDGDEAGDTAVFVDNECHVERIRLHVVQHVVDRLHFGNEHGFPHDVPDGECIRVETAVRSSHDVFDVENASNVVDGVFDNGDTGVSGA